MLFSKALKAVRSTADKGCVTTLAHTTMTSARSADSGPAGPGEPDRRAHAESTGAPRATSVPAWDSGEADMARAAGRRAAGNRGRGLHGQLVQQLGQMIASGDIGADRPLVPEEIGQRFEVSRTVVRESLRVLEAKGLVSARPNVGTRVRPVSDWNLLDPDIIEWRAFGPQRENQRRELCELRWAIEPLAARLAADRGGDETQQRLADMVGIMGHTLAQGDALTFSRADAEFHALLLQAAGNRMLEHLSGIVGAALRVSGAPAAGCERPTEASVAHHRRIADAVASGEAAVAEGAVRQLLAVSSELSAPAPGSAVPSDTPAAPQQGGSSDHVVPAPREH
ncbi:FadR/GntR family transcriptional regulator [Streptomyces sp. TRM 70361]|uniref:FadR/GntR family transcriptional regulator n=1 Tax=Streptomyces sp. TRM 70361 TaxID=3116553 RepID=UPI002E7B7F23|nr:FadR/GntR family transcriptional regulator [Streptomyces sp. TRM 70361]MEE1940910.1 FadR/GntR family transcriptional regulator [Streptomyces sp. TRM 70361]